MAEEQKEQQESSDKIEKKFKQNIQKINTLLKGEGYDDKMKADGKIPKGELDGIIEELFKEEREKNAAELKEQFKKLITNYREFSKIVRDKEKELEKVKSDKMKEYNKDADTIFRKIKDDQEEQQQSVQALQQAAGGPPQGPVS